MIRRRNTTITLALCYMLALSTPAISAEPSATSDTSVQLLQPQLDSMKTQFKSRAPQEMVDLYQWATDELRMSGILERALNVNDTAPDFDAVNAVGDTSRLSALLQRGPVVIVWYRGGWCPYCNLTLRSWMDVLPSLQQTGATLVAISPEIPDSSLSTTEKLKLDFEVLSDSDNHVARQFGIVYKLPDAVAAAYSRHFSLSAYNGNESNELPLAATYVIDTHRVIRYAFLDADYTKRSEPADIIKSLRNLYRRNNE